MQARNQVKFRAILGVIVAILSLVLQIVLSKYYQEIGCAVAIAIMFFLGQGVVINIYYSKKQNLNILAFWREISKMSIVPIIITGISLLCINSYNIDNWIKLFITIIIFCSIYVPLFWIFSMNKYERSLIISPLNKLLRKC